MSSIFASRHAPVMVIVLAALALFPIFGSSFYVDLVTKILILAIFAMSLDLLVGCTGLVSLGHAAYFGIAAYTLVLVAPKYEAASMWTTLPLCMLSAGIAAALIGLLVLRTRGIYFIMVTLAFAQMAFFVFHDTALGGGSDGVYLNFKPELKLGAVRLIDLEQPAQFFYLVLTLAVLVYLFLMQLMRSPFGHALSGIRVNAQRMESLGFPVFCYQLAAFTLAGTIGGLAGYLAACQFGFVNPEILAWHQSGNALLMIILGGMGQIYGAVLGAFAFVLLQESFSAFTKHWQLGVGLTIVALVLFFPGGLLGIAKRVQRTRERPHG